MVEAIVVRQPRPGRPGCGLRHRYSGPAVPAGRLAVFWNSFRPPVDVDEAFAEVWHRVFGSPFSLAALADPEAYSAMCTKAADGMRQAGAFGDPEEWRFDWDRPYTHDEWLGVGPTLGGFNHHPPAKPQEPFAGIGRATHAAGATVTVGPNAAVAPA